jgi:hypothetical protein
MSKFELFYNKIPKKIENIISDLCGNYIISQDDYNPYSLEKVQYYHPLYNKFFHLEDNNYNRITLNHRYQFINNEYVHDTIDDTKKQKNTFIKFSPLIDPIRYMIGKFKEEHSSLNNLPKLENENKIHQNLTDVQNVSYVDNFCYYLASKILHSHNIVHGIDYYGSFLGMQSKFKVDVGEDIEYLSNSEYFHENINNLYELNKHYEQYNNSGSRANREKLKISKTNHHNITFNSLPELENRDINIEYNTINNELIYEKKITNKTLTNDSNIVSTDEESIESCENPEEDSDSDNSEISVSSGEEEEEYDNDTVNSSLKESKESTLSLSSYETIESSYEDEEILAYIYNYPIQCICIEKCNGTFDSLFENEEMTSHQGICALFQIIMNLITYQKCFHLTHNDLHTNNIMYIKTNEEFLYYKVNKQYYKVPTYGKIYKIIDFGRSIYKFNGRMFMGNCFGPNGDASTQYNCEPYMNEKKPRVDPNFSFDLCRLGCSIYDFIIDEEENPDDFNDLQSVVSLWCKDDYNKNILYKKNGEERYPDFKLYKMIARTVHNHLPENQLKLPYFSAFEISNNIPENIKIMDLDNLPCYV